MATQLQIRRGTAAQVAAFTGAEGEVVVNTTNDSIHVNDGSTAGGFELARVDGSNWAITNAISTTANISFGDNDKAIFGAGSDLQIYHDGSHSYISDQGTGQLRILASQFQVMNAAGTESMVFGAQDNTATLYYDNAAKLATTSTGIDVTGTVTADGLALATASDITFGSSSVGIQGNASGADYIKFTTNSNERLNIASTGDISFYEDTGTTPKMVWSSSAESLGIGTTNPLRGLDLRTAASGFGNVFLVDTTSGTTGTGGGVIFGSDDGQGTDVSVAAIQGIKENSTAGNQQGALLFTTKNSIAQNLERMRIDSNGNLLVGRTSRLTNQVESISSDTVVSAHGSLSSHQTNAAIMQYTSNEMILRSYGATAGTGEMVFKTGGGGGSTDSEAMRIDASGNVGIGNSSITNALGWSSVAQVGGANPALSLKNASNVQWDISNFGGTFNIYNGSANRLRIDASGNLLVDTTSAPYAGMKISTGNTSRSEAGLQIQTSTSGVGYVLFGDGTAGSAYVGQVFYNHGSDSMGFATSGLERARIDSSGNLLVGKTSVGSNITGINFSPAGSATFAVDYTSTNEIVIFNNNNATGTNYQVDFRQNNTEVGNITAGSSSVSFNTSSDYRLKENIADADDAGSKIDAIQVRKFDWIADGSHQDYGMVAQELVTVAPEAVTGDADSDEMMGVDYSKLVPMLVKEIQSLRNRVAQLENN